MLHSSTVENYLEALYQAKVVGAQIPPSAPLVQPRTTGIN